VLRVIVLKVDQSYGVNIILLFSDIENNMDEIKNTNISINVVPITDNDKQVVMNSLKQYFFYDEPLCASLGLTEEKESVIQLEKFCADILQSGKLINFHCK